MTSLAILAIPTIRPFALELAFNTSGVVFLGTGELMVGGAGLRLAVPYDE